MYIFINNILMKSPYDQTPIDIYNIEITNSWHLNQNKMYEVFEHNVI